MPNRPDDNKIAPDVRAVEESRPVDWDNIAIAVPHDVKTDIIVAARQQRLTVSEWGRAVILAALASEGFADRRSGVDRRSPDMAPDAAA